MYRIFDTTLRCDFPLPELAQSRAQDFSISVVLGDLQHFDDQGFEQSFEWPDYSGRIVCWCARRADEYLFSFPGHATFHVSSAAVISCMAHENATMQMLRHLLLNQIIPRYLASTGRLVLHASAVTLQNGRCFAFLGNSGFGKSTLASSFHRNGAQLISDDSILLRPGEHRVTAIGGFAGIRLFPDSVHAVFDEAAGFTNYSPYTDKQQLVLKHKAGGVQPEAVVLDALFLLDDPAQSKEDDSVCIEPVSGSTAMLAMIACAFSLDPSDRQMIAANFQNVGQTISEHLGLFKLRYPRKHERLGDVRAAVTNAVA